MLFHWVVYGMLATVSALKGEQLFQLPILHMNDFHARFEPIDFATSGRCHPDQEKACIGGISRIHGLVKAIKREKPNAIFLNGGDNFQGTLWYTMFRWNVTAEFFSMLQLDAVTIGNHEFDNQVDGLTPFLKRLNCPVVAANIDASLEPELQKHLMKSTVIIRNGIKIGIVGYVLHTFNEISQTGKLKFLDEIASVNEEAKALKQSGVSIIIGLSHAGLEKDKEVARGAPDLDVIVGGHSHTFMYTGPSPSPYDKPAEVYPFVVDQLSGRKVLIVQAAAYSRFLGNLTVFFDSDGEVRSWEGNPILLDNKVQQDQDMNKALEPWKESVKRKGSRVVGKSKVLLDAAQSVCYRMECNLGNIITDAMVYQYVDEAITENYWSNKGIALINAGGIRTSISSGVITYADLMGALPFESVLVTIEMKGKYLKDVIEFSLKQISGFLQWSGIKVTIDVSQPEGQRVRAIHAVCIHCRVPRYHPVKPESSYRIILNDFLYNGGDGFTQFKEYGINYKEGIQDNVVLMKYFQRSGLVITGLQGRITMLHAHLPHCNLPRTIFG